MKRENLQYRLSDCKSKGYSLSRFSGVGLLQEMSILIGHPKEF